MMSYKLPEPTEIPCVITYLEQGHKEVHGMLVSLKNGAILNIKTCSNSSYLVEDLIVKDQVFLNALKTLGMSVNLICDPVKRPNILNAALNQLRDENFEEAMEFEKRLASYRKQ